MKVFAAICMLIDHIGMVFFPGQWLWRLIGRLAMPIFAYCVGRGLVYTSSRKKYSIRLGVFALLSQIPFYLMQKAAGIQGNFHLNIGFTFLMAILCVIAFERVYDYEQQWIGQKIIWLLVFIFVLILSDLLNMDYGSYGILMVILCFLQIKAKRPFWQLIVGALLLTYIIYRGVAAGFILQCFGIIGFLVCYLLKDISEKRLGRFFYVFYPLHMMIIWGVSFLV